jgi:hypothetical protein
MWQSSMDVFSVQMVVLIGGSSKKEDVRLITIDKLQRNWIKTYIAGVCHKLETKWTLETLYYICLDHLSRAVFKI